MQVVVQDIKGQGIKTLVFNPETDRYFIVSSIENNEISVSETFIFRADEEGHITNYEEVWGTTSISHEDVVRLLEEDVLSEEYFIMEEN